jgi:hypothetical protein
VPYSPSKTLELTAELVDDLLKVIADIRFQNWPVPGMGVGLTTDQLDELLNRGEYVESRLKPLVKQAVKSRTDAEEYKQAVKKAEAFLAKMAPEERIKWRAEQLAKFTNRTGMPTTGIESFGLCFHGRDDKICPKCNPADPPVDSEDTGDSSRAFLPN